MVVLCFLSYPEENYFGILGIFILFYKCVNYLFKEQMNYAFSLFFIVEIFLKMSAVGIDKFKDDIFNVYELIFTFIIIVNIILIIN